VSRDAVMTSGRRRKSTAMGHDQEIYCLANIFLRMYGGEAPLIAARRAEAEIENGDVAAELAWKAVLRAVQELTRTERGPGERVN
jgi:hypothetical protein